MQDFLNTMKTALNGYWGQWFEHWWGIPFFIAGCGYVYWFCWNERRKMRRDPMEREAKVREDFEALMATVDMADRLVLVKAMETDVENVQPGDFELVQHLREFKDRVLSLSPTSNATVRIDEIIHRWLYEGPARKSTSGFAYVMGRIFWEVVFHTSVSFLSLAIGPMLSLLFFIPFGVAGIFLIFGISIFWPLFLEILRAING